MFTFLSYFATDNAFIDGHLYFKVQHLRDIVNMCMDQPVCRVGNLLTHAEGTRASTRKTIAEKHPWALPTIAHTYHTSQPQCSTSPAELTKLC